MTLRQLIITLENGQEVEGESHIFSNHLPMNDRAYGHIAMTYYIHLPIDHPMFKKLVGLEATMLEDIDDLNIQSFVIEVQRALVLTREQYDSLDAYDEIHVDDRVKIDDLDIEVVGYVDDTYSLVECEGTVLTDTVKKCIEDHDSSKTASAWSMFVGATPFAFAVPTFQR